jgi:hypothetical protein
MDEFAFHVNFGMHQMFVNRYDVLSNVVSSDTTCKPINTTGWAFTGVSGAKTMFNLIPFIFIVGIVLYFILAMLGKT